MCDVSHLKSAVHHAHYVVELLVVEDGAVQLHVQTELFGQTLSSCFAFQGAQGRRESLDTTTSTYVRFSSITLDVVYQSVVFETLGKKLINSSWHSHLLLLLVVQLMRFLSEVCHLCTYVFKKCNAWKSTATSLYCIYTHMSIWVWVRVEICENCETQNTWLRTLSSSLNH